MTCHQQIFKWALAAYAALFFASALPAGAAESLQLPELMSLLAARGAHQAQFVERKYLPVLDAPVESSGTLRFTPPDRLEKRTLKPREELLLLEGRQLLLQQGKRERRLALDDIPELALMIDSLRATLAGDLNGLSRAWNVSLQGTRPRWTLELQPAALSMRQLLTLVRIEGSQGQLRQVELLQADGARSVMTVVTSSGDTAGAVKSATPNAALNAADTAANTMLDAGPTTSSNINSNRGANSVSNPAPKTSVNKVSPTSATGALNNTANNAAHHAAASTKRESAAP